jgi:hypothetical protein
VTPWIILFAISVAIALIVIAAGWLLTGFNLGPGPYEPPIDRWFNNRAKKNSHPRK